MEVWKSIIETELLYSVSNHGRIRRDIENFKGATSGRILTPKMAGYGYRQVHLYVQGKCLIRYVHTLVLEAFVCDRPSGLVANHKDGIREIIVLIILNGSRIVKIINMLLIIICGVMLVARCIDYMEYLLLIGDILCTEKMERRILLSN